MKKYWWVFLIIILLFLFAIIYCGIIGYLISDSSRFKPLGGEGIAVIRIDGAISASGEGSFDDFSATPENIISQLKRADEDNRVKAILIRINSPGGTAAASQEIFYELKKIKKKVVVSIADIGASGAYWISCGSDYIYALPASDVGSIGVIIAIPNLTELLDKIGVDYIVITQGKYKDIGNPAREMTDEEKKILNAQANKIYKLFIEDVAEARGLSLNNVEKLATGLSYPGQEALELGLIDELGSYEDAIDKAADLGKIEGEPQIIEYREKSFINVFENLLTSRNIRLEELYRLFDNNKLNDENKIIK